MAIKRLNPLGLQVVQSEVQPNIDAELRELDSMIDDADEAQSGWITKQVNLEKLRMGHREPRNIPWEGSSNISVPVIDGIIRRARPGLASLILDANPIATFESQEATDIDTAREIEPFLTWLFKKRMKTVREATLLIDYILARGHAYTHEGWDYQTSRSVRIVQVDTLFGDLNAFLQAAEAEASQQGQKFNPGDAIVVKLEQEYGLSSQSNPEEATMLVTAASKILSNEKYIRLFFRKVSVDRPSWQAIDPINVIKPPDQDASNADFFTIVHRVGRDRLIQMAQDNILNETAVAALLKKMRSNTDDSNREYGGVRATNARDMIREIRDGKADVENTGKKSAKAQAILFQTYCRIDINGDGVAERCVYWNAPEHKIRLALFEYPLPMDEWPITPFHYSNDLPRSIDQRGIPEMVAPFQKLVNAYHNAWVDATTIQLAPMMKVRVMEGEKIDIEWRPGGIIPFTGNSDDIVPLTHDLGVLGELLRAENVNQTHAENYIGIFDASIRNVTQRSERRTATEVGAIQNISDSIFGLDAKLFQESFSKSLNKILKLWLEFGPPEVYFRVEGRELPLKITREELDKDFDISASGTPSNTQRAILQRNIETIIPFSLQMADTGLIDIAELFKQYFRLIEFPLAEKIVRSTEEATVIQEVLAAHNQMTGTQDAPAV